jgi:transcriptional regulator with XRE-family HTH domain
MPSRKRHIRQAEVVKRFAHRLREVRLSRGMTQAALAHRAHVTVSYVWRLESGGAAPGIDLVDRLADTLGMTAADLLPPAARPDTVAVLRAQAERLFQALVQSANEDDLLMLNPLLARLGRSR